MVVDEYVGRCLNSLGWLTVERESRVGGLVMVCVWFIKRKQRI